MCVNNLLVKEVLLTPLQGNQLLQSVSRNGDIQRGTIAASYVAAEHASERRTLKARRRRKNRHVLVGLSRRIDDSRGSAFEIQLRREVSIYRAREPL